MWFFLGMIVGAVGQMLIGDDKPAPKREREEPVPAPAPKPKPAAE